MSSAGSITSIPDLAFFLGVAGGVQDVKLGDVVAATVVHDYERGKEGPDGYESRSLQHKSAFPLKQLAGMTEMDAVWQKRIQAANEELLDPPPRALVEEIAAGEKVVAKRDSTTGKLISEVAPRAVAVEMEGAGFLNAVDRFSKVDGLVVRGISDLLDHKHKSDAFGWQQQAAANAAAFLFEMLIKSQPAPE